jgi:hypothetical protein
MTPKEKAEHLYNLFVVFELVAERYTIDNFSTIRNCIKICDEVLTALSYIDFEEKDTTVYNMCLFYNETITELKNML